MNDMERYCVQDGVTILEGIESIDRSDSGFSVVVDADGKVKGVLTDGDIRRALLAGYQLDSPLMPHVHAEFLSVTQEATRVEVLDLMQARKIRHVPVIGSSGELKRIHLLSSIIGSNDLPNWAVIMAGGKGTRLRPLTEHLPKPMIKVAGRPILERLILHLVGHGVKRIFLSVNYMSDVIEEHFKDGADFGCSIEYLREDEPLGTGGSLSLLPELPSDPVLVMNGDLVMQVNLERMLQFHHEGGYSATMGVKPYHHEVPFGCVETNKGKIVSIREKPSIDRLINAGVYAISPDVLKAIPKSFYPITELFQQTVEKGGSCGAFVIDEDWMDVGRMDDLNKAQGH
jgi:dTDP-glucose pyrophosphorylase